MKLGSPRHECRGDRPEVFKVAGVIVAVVGVLLGSLAVVLLACLPDQDPSRGATWRASHGFRSDDPSTRATVDDMGKYPSDPLPGEELVFPGLYCRE